MVGALSILSTIFVGLTSLMLGMSFSSNTSFEFITSDLEYLGAFCLKLFTFFSFGLFLGILVKRSAFAVGALIIWYIIEKITIGLIAGNVRSSDANSFVNFLPLESSSALIHEPISRMDTIQQISQEISPDMMAYDYGVPTINIIAAISWSVLFYLGSNLLIKKRDL
jgi:ABC-type transport system involved in multi-copper enzyme maturation permease subunit